MVQSGRDLTRPGVWITGNSQLAERRAQVEIGALAHHPIPLEFEHDDDWEIDGPSSWRQSSPEALMGSPEIAFYDHSLVRIPHASHVEMEIGECAFVLVEKGCDLDGTVVDFSGRDNLVTRMCECVDASLELVPVLRGHVFENDLHPLASR